MELILQSLAGPGAGEEDLEIVERRGAGHPDAICDALAAYCDLVLARYWRDRFDALPEGRLDWVLLVPGLARAGFGGGQVIEPMEIFLAGELPREHRGIRIPLEDLILNAAREWLRDHLRALDVERHVRFRPMMRGVAGGAGGRIPGPVQGFGYAPLSPLESTVLTVDRRLNSRKTHAAHPGLGEDVRIAGLRRGQGIHLGVECAFIGRNVADEREYRANKDAVAALVRDAAASLAGTGLEVEVNAGDDMDRGRVFLTVTGTAAESAGGISGRGNGPNGLISARHPGGAARGHPWYDAAAGLVAEAVAAEVPGTVDVRCRLRGADPRDEPALAAVSIRFAEGADFAALSARAGDVARARLAQLGSVRDDWIAGDVVLGGWPYRRPEPDPLLPPDEYAVERAAMVLGIEREALETASWTGRPRFAARVLEAMARVPRHRFVPRERRQWAYGAGPLPIGHGQTISAPYIVALMTDLAGIAEGAKVLEVGTGSGYQAAVLAEVGARVFSVETVAELAQAVRRRFDELGYRAIATRHGDGSLGWPEQAPFDAIVVTAAARDIPPALVDQLAPGGRLVIPVGPPGGEQQLIVIERDPDGRLSERVVLPVIFVPLVEGR